MKKFSLILLSALLALCLWGCGGDKGEDGPSPSPSVSPSPSPSAAPKASPSVKPKSSPSVKPRATVKPSGVVDSQQEESSSSEESEPEYSEPEDDYEDYQAEGTPPPDETIEPAGGNGSGDDDDDDSPSPSDFVGRDVNALYGAFGLPNSSSYASSCMGPGQDGILYYDGFTVYTYEEDGYEVIQSIE